MSIALELSSFHMPLGSPDAPNRAQGSGPVESKADSARVKQGGCAREQVYPLVAEMVRDQQQLLGSRMGAYDIVGRWLGVGPTWVRRLIGRQAVAVSGDRLLAITAAYRNHCGRVERRAAESRAATARRWEEIDALLHGLGAPDQRGPGLAAESGGDDLGPAPITGVRP